MSISFDRAAEYYDQTRGMPVDVANQITESIIRLTHANAHSRLLEIGVGTGRIALPLYEHGYDITGIDLSRLMMEQLVKKTIPHADSAGQSATARATTQTHPRSRISLAQADMARLPLASDSFDGVIAVHVLHLSPAWREAVAEVRRVLTKGAPLLASWHHRGTYSPNRILRDKLAKLALEYGVNAARPGAAGNEDMRAEFGKWGTAVELVDVVSWEERMSLGEILAAIDRQIFSDTWLIPRPVLDKVMPRLREFAHGEFGPPEREVVEPATFTWIIARK